MPTPRLHEDEVATDPDLVRRLVAGQFPEYAALEVSAVQSMGTVNAIYRLGADMCVRLPRHQRWAGDVEKELRWLGFLGPRLPLHVPQPIAGGEPAHGYPCRWAIYRWLPGETYAEDRVDDEISAATDLAHFVSQLRLADVTGAPTAAWERALLTPPWDGRPVWRHCDLLPSNLLVSGGRLHAVIDFGMVGAGDPAADVIAAWAVFGADGRDRFRDVLGVDDETWGRARGYALHQALCIIPYYEITNPAFVAMAKRTVREVLSDLEW